MPEAAGGGAGSTVKVPLAQDGKPPAETAEPPISCPGSVSGWRPVCSLREGTGQGQPGAAGAPSALCPEEAGDGVAADRGLWGLRRGSSGSEARTGQPTWTWGEGEGAPWPRGLCELGLLSPACSSKPEERDLSSTCWPFLRVDEAGRLQHRDGAASQNLAPGIITFSPAAEALRELGTGPPSGPGAALSLLHLQTSWTWLLPSAGGSDTQDSPAGQGRAELPLKVTLGQTPGEATAGSADTCQNILGVAACESRAGDCAITHRILRERNQTRKSTIALTWSTNEVRRQDRAGHGRRQWLGGGTRGLLQSC
ncbi:uncharacterized protein LOC144382654 [Halichoerus grypus]